MPWQPLDGTTTEIVAIHAALLPTSPQGDILCFGDWAGSGSGGVVPTTLSRLYHVADGTLTGFGDDDLPTTNAFCGGQASLADGRLLVAGGTVGWPEAHVGLHDDHYDGERACWVYLPREQRWFRVRDLNFQPGNNSIGGGRWYPTLVTLGNGEVIAIGGHPSETDNHDGRHNNTTPERYAPAADSWTLLASGQTAPNGRPTDSYPRYHLMPSGMLFCDTSGDEGTQRLLDPQTGLWTGNPVDVDDLPGYYSLGSAATSVLLPLLPPSYAARVLACNSPHQSAFRVSVAGNPTWEATGDRSPANRNTDRENGCATLLPNGRVLLTGGWPRDTEGDIDTATRRAELYDPGIDWATGSFTGSDQWLDTDGADEVAEVGRGYHSVALLLPDGRVWTAGSTTEIQENRVEIYAPSYVGLSRPTVSGAPASVSYGLRFTVTVDRAIERVAFMRCGSITHGFDSDQRYVGLVFEQDGDTLTITAPPHGSIAPPGNYMLWVVDSNDRPCTLAPFVRLSHQQLLLYTDRSTFSVHEVNATGLPSQFNYAFYVILEGVLPHEAGEPVELPAIEFRYPGGDAVPGMAAMIATTKWEDPATPPDVAQRLTFGFHIRFDTDAAFDAITGDSDTIVLHASHGVFSASANLILSRNPNPWMRDGEVHWLSTDVRVFQLQPGMTRGGIEHGAGANAPFEFIQSLVAAFDAAPADETHPFLNELEVDQEESALTFAREAANGEPVFNYAVAKVRMRAPPEVTAEDVGVFFRLFSTASTGFEYAANVYARDGAGAAAYPVVGRIGGDIITIPFFAGPRASEGDPQSDATNRKTIDGAGAAEVHRYFGCWLDINQETPVFEEDGDMKSVQEILKGEHQCLVAELDYALDPIPPNATPGSNENLSQRNLIIDAAPNPAGPATRVIAHTLEIAPSKTPAQLPPNIGGMPGSSVTARLTPDELVFDWRNVPRGSQVTLYLPDVDVDQVLALAARRQGPPMLARVDAHTLRLTVGGITYVPIPGGRTRTIPSLLSLQLPPDLVKGTVYKATVKQFEGRRRRILASVQITIPITTSEEILPNEVRKLAVLRHIASKLKPVNKWYPIFERYLGIVGDRVRGLGGDPDRVEPSPTGNPPRRRPEDKPDIATFAGKIIAVLYDCFGDFEGFVIESCDSRRRFTACARGIERVVRSACRDASTVTVTTDRRSGRIVSLVVGCC